MMKKRAVQVRWVKDADANEASSAADFETTVAHVTIGTRMVMQEMTKMVAALLILDTGRKILINRLSK